MPSFASQLLRFFLKLFLGVVTAVFALSLLAAGLIALAASLLKWGITGRKPGFAIAFGRFRQFSRQSAWHGPSDTSRQPAKDVVDVEVREVGDDKRLP